MKTRSLVIVFLVFAAVGSGFPVQAEFKINPDVLAEMTFPIPQDPKHQKYLGISGSGEFKLSQIKADRLIIELFSMYCPICQAEAENINKLYEMIENSPKHKGKIKLIGIGTGNTPFEVNVFAKKYSVPFPLFADDQFRIQKASSENIRTPTFLSVSLQGDKMKIHSIKQGEVQNVSELLNVMTK